MKNQKLFQSLTNHINKNLFLYIITFLFLCIGIVIGAYSVKYMDSSEKAEIINNLLNYSQNVSINSINKKYTFLQALKNNFSFILITWFLGLTMLGAPLVLILDLIKGYTIGFTSSIVVSGLGAKGVLLNLLALFPQNIIYLPCIIISSVIAIEFSLILFKSNSINKEGNLIYIATYSALFLLIALFMFMGFFIEGYFTPNMLKFLVYN